MNIKVGDFAIVRGSYRNLMLEVKGVREKTFLGYDHYMHTVAYNRVVYSGSKHKVQQLYEKLDGMRDEHDKQSRALHSKYLEECRLTILEADLIPSVTVAVTAGRCPECHATLVGADKHYDFCGQKGLL